MGTAFGVSIDTRRTAPDGHLRWDGVRTEPVDTKEVQLKQRGTGEESGQNSIYHNICVPILLVTLFHNVLDLHKRRINSLLIE